MYLVSQHSSSHTHVRHHQGIQSREGQVMGQRSRNSNAKPILTLSLLWRWQGTKWTLFNPQHHLLMPQHPLKMMVKPTTPLLDVCISSSSLCRSQWALITCIVGWSQGAFIPTLCSCLT